MSAIRFAPGYRIEPLRQDHPRLAFPSGQVRVDDWLANKSLQNLDKHLSAAASTTRPWRFTGVGISARYPATTTESF